MADAEREHPDEGTIHAWLDGALDDATARTLAAHVATCRDCAERVAEARGLIAGASRVVSALDDTPSTTSPSWGQTPPAAASPRPVRRLLRVTPGRAAIAATVLVALGVALTYERTAVESQATHESAPAASTVAAAPMQDAVLDSAVARNLAIAQPKRAVAAAPGPAIPTPPAAPVPANVVADRAAAQKVATARAELRAEREPSAAAAADQLPSRAADVRRADAEKVVAAAAKADSAAGGGASIVMRAGVAPAAAASRSRAMAMTPPSECYRVESANGTAATWATVELPFVVRLDSAGRRAAVLGAAGESTGSSALVGRRGEDSLLLDLRRIGFSGTLALGATGGDAWAGVMRSRPLETHLGEVVTTAAPSAQERRAAARRAPAAKAAPPAAPTEAAAGLNAAPAVPVVARRITCP